MKNYIYLFLIVLLVGFSACNSDFEVNDQWKDVPVVFCVLDASQEYQYVKVNKCFLGNLPASEMASVSDSLFYNCDVEVRLYKKNGKNYARKWDFNRIDSIPKSAGYFANDKNTIWVGKPQLELGADYELEVNIDNGRIVARANTVVVNNITPKLPDLFAKKVEIARYDKDSQIKFYCSENSNFYQVVVSFNYLEILTNGDTLHKSIDFYNISEYSDNVDNWTIKEKSFSNATLYSSIVSQIGSNDNVAKRLVSMPNSVTYNIMAADENLYTYMQVTKPASGIAQDKPLFTNIYLDESSDAKYKDAFGIFASRYIYSYSKALGSTTLDSLANGIYTKDFKFANRYDDYYILNGMHK